MMLYLVFILLGYALGGVLFSYHIPKLLLHINIVSCSEDGNPGSSNAFKYAGVPVGILCLVCDLAKGFLPVFFAAVLLGPQSLLFALVAVAPVLGHATAPYYRFGGGKAIATSFGAMLGFIPYSFVVFVLAFFYIFFSVVIVIDPHEKRSVVTFVVFSSVVLLAVFFTRKFSVALASLGIAAIAILRNRRQVPIESGTLKERIKQWI